MAAIKDITGQRFGRLVVIEPSHIHRTERSMYWRCLCDCGNELVTCGKRLRKGQSKSCGCLLSEWQKVFGQRQLRHGQARRGQQSKIHGVWNTMIQRCTNPAADGYAYCGSRGIRVCERWLGFANFYADVGDPPPGLTLDRIDNDGNYEPGNVRWATAKEQALNRRPKTEEHRAKLRANMLKAQKARWAHKHVAGL